MRLPRPGHWSLMVKIPLTITAVMLGVALAVGLIVIQQNWTRQRAALEDRTLLLARAAGANAAEAILRNDVWFLYRALKQVSQRSAEALGPAVLSAVFVDSVGRVLAHLHPAEHPVGLMLPVASETEATLLAHALAASEAGVAPEDLRDPGFVDAVVPIVMDDTRIGSLMIRASTAPLKAQLRHDAMTILAMALGLAAIGSVLGALVSRRMVSPLHALSRGLEALTRGDFDAARPVCVIDRDEVGLLAEQFNRMIRELAEKKRLERDLANAERLAGLGRFAAGLAHEVNNPLAGMLNCVSMMKKRPGDAALSGKYVPLLETGLTRIAATMQALLGELRGETRSRPCALSCMSDLEGIVRSEIGDRPIRLDWRGRELVNATIGCTCPHVHQIVLNLARNAVEAMRDRGGDLTIEAARDGHDLRICVTDTGPGVDEAAQRHIFEPFYSTGDGGTGLGLWITYRLAERMGGRIAVRSSPGEGACFTVTIPLQRAAAEEAVHAA